MHSTNQRTMYTVQIFNRTDDLLLSLKRSVHLCWISKILIIFVNMALLVI